MFASRCCLRVAGFSLRNGRLSCKQPALASGHPWAKQAHAGTTCMHMPALIALNPHPCVFCRLKSKKGGMEKDENLWDKTRVSKARKKNTSRGRHVPRHKSRGKGKCEAPFFKGQGLFPSTRPPPSLHHIDLAHNNKQPAQQTSLPSAPSSSVFLSRILTIRQKRRDSMPPA